MYGKSLIWRQINMKRTLNEQKTASKHTHSFSCRKFKWRECKSAYNWNSQRYFCVYMALSCCHRLSYVCIFRWLNSSRSVTLEWSLFTFCNKKIKIKHIFFQLCFDYLLEQFYIWLNRILLRAHECNSTYLLQSIRHELSIRQKHTHTKRGT